MTVLARDIMSHPVVAVGPDATLAETARLMVEKRIGSVVVLDAGGNLQGLLTEGDFSGKAGGLSLTMMSMPRVFGHWVPFESLETIYASVRDRPVAEAMNKDPVQVASSLPVDDVVAQMVRRDVKHVVVVDGRKVVGVVARHDLLRLMLRNPFDGPGPN